MIQVRAVIIFMAPSEASVAELRSQDVGITASEESSTWLDLAQEVGRIAQKEAEESGWELVSINLNVVWS